MKTGKRFCSCRGLPFPGRSDLDFIDGMAKLHPKTIARQFYSDYVTPLDDDIAVEGTAFHVIYALKMGKKYGARYRRHFHNPDIHEFDMKHEIWLYDDTWKPKVMAMIDACMGEKA